MTHHHLTPAAFLALALASSGAQAQEADQPVDNGTNPARFNTTAIVSYETADLDQGISIDTFELSYIQPFTADKDYNIRFKLPFARIDGANSVFSDNFDLGDAQVKISHLAKKDMKNLTALVIGAEMSFDTAARPELGAGQNVLKLNATYAKGLSNKAIFAPAVVHSISLWGDDGRAKVNNTVFDFYYVPKLKNPKYFITFDPSITLDWETDAQFIGLATTFGRVIGPAFGGNSVMYIKPSTFLGGDAPPINWGIEVGYKLIGF